MASCQSKEFVVIENSAIRATLCSDKPVLAEILYAGETIKPATGKGLTINGELKEWNDWDIKSSQERRYCYL